MDRGNFDVNADSCRLIRRRGQGSPVGLLFRQKLVSTAKENTKHAMHEPRTWDDC